METADAHEQSRYYDALRKMFNEDELEILSQICSSNNNEVTAGFRNMLKLEVHRRHIVAYAVKKNSTGAEQISDIINRCHLQNCNLAYEMQLPRYLALNNQRLLRYLDPKHPTISQRAI